MSLITLSQAKSWLGILDAERDALLTALAAAASDACTHVLGGRSLLVASRTEILSGTGGEVQPVNHIPIRSVTSVTIVTQALTASSYTFDDNAIYLKNGLRFPRGPKNVTVVYSGGLDAIPAPVLLAAQYTVKAMWDARKTDMNATSESFPGIGGNGFWQDGPGAVPPQARALLRPYARLAKVP